MHPELEKHPEHNECTRNIGHEPTGILRHLKNGGGIVIIETGLKKGVTSVTQRVVHKNQGFPIFMFAGIGELDAAGEILGDISSGISIVAKLEKLDREGFIETLRTQGNLPGLPIDLKTD